MTKKLYVEVILFLGLIIVYNISNYALGYFSLELTDGAKVLYWILLFILIFIILIQILIRTLESHIIFLLSLIGIPSYIFLVCICLAFFIGPSLEHESKVDVCGNTMLAVYTDYLKHDEITVRYYPYINKFIREKNKIIFTTSKEDLYKYYEGEDILDKIYKDSLKDNQ